MRIVAAINRAKGHVRPIVAEDLDAITVLHREVFGSGTTSRDELRRRLLDLFFDHPWIDERLPSMVYEDEAGDIVGCLGVMPRPMSIDGRPILAALSHNFMVASHRRSTMAALEMLRAFHAGPQGLSFAVGNEASRRLWSAMGGTTSIAYSFRFTLPLRPARFAIERARRGVPAPLAMALRPLGAAFDLAATRLDRSPFRRRRPDARIAAEPLDAATLAQCVERFSRRRSLRPHYDVAAIERMLEIVERGPDQGALRRVLLRREGRVIGWYLAFLERPGCAAVLQVGVAEDAAADVFDHLFDDAWMHGACGITGQLDPGLLPALSERPCLFHRGAGDRWLLVHSRDERAQRALHLGDAFFTHLEGEWWA
jgi:hypothetical protein